MHDEKLIKTYVDNERGAWSAIRFNKEKTPYPKIGVSIGCTGIQSESVIKFCPKCEETRHH